MLISCIAFSQSPYWEWAVCPSGNSFSFGMDVVADDSGNVYSVGQFGDTAIFGTDTIVGGGMYIVKYDSAGTVQWARSAAGNSIARGIALDVWGDIYVCGNFREDTIIFGSDTLLNPASTFNSCDAFLVKYDDGGNVLWAQRFGGLSGANGDDANDVTCDPAGNIYLVGHFECQSIQFNNITLTSTPGYTRHFIVRFDSSGYAIWGKASSGPGSAMCHGVTVDQYGNIAVTGMIGGTAIFGTDTVTGSGNGGIYLMKYDSTGNVIWIKTPICFGCYWSSGGSVASDDFGNFYFTGNFGGDSIHFGNITLSKLNGFGFSDAFVVKYDSIGNAIWADNGHLVTGQASGVGIMVDAQNSVFITGRFSDSIRFGNQTFVNDNNVNGYWELYIAKYSNGGTLLWAKNTQGSGMNMALGVASNTQLDVYMTGSFADTVVFDGDSVTFSPNNSMFISKLGSGLITSQSPSNAENPVRIFPNPTSGIFVLESDSASGIIEIYNGLGDILSKFEMKSLTQFIDLRTLPNGIYFVKFVSGETVFIQKIILQK